MQYIALIMFDIQCYDHAVCVYQDIDWTGVFFMKSGYNILY